MRRLLAIGMTISMLGAVAGCGPETTSTTSTQIATVAPTATTLGAATTVEERVGARTESDLVFATRIRDGATLTLDIHLPAEPENAPIVINPIGRAVGSLIEQGVTVVTWDENDHLGEGPGGPEEIVADSAFVRGMAELIGCTVRLARVGASDLGSDDPRVVLSGVSFGGGLAVQVALFGDTLDARWEGFVSEGGPPRQFDCEVTGGSTQVDAVIGMAGTYDLSMPIFDGMYGRAHQQEHNPEMQEFLASTIGANPDLTLRLIHGIYDDIPVENAEQFAEMLSAAGYDVQLTTWAGGHEEPPTELFVSTIMAVLDR
jgi:hypothetical protein